MFFTGLRCVGCGETHQPDRDLLLCPACDNLLDAIYDYEGMRHRIDRDAVAARPHGVWRWHELLPILDRDAIVTLGEGDTPILRCNRLAEYAGVRELWVKSDGSNPTGSLKDRSVTVAATKAVEFGYSVLSCDSTGNKASSVAAYAARAGLSSVVFCPQDTPLPKVTQAVFFGARLMRVDGHYSEVNAMYRRLIKSGEVKWYDCGTDNPFRYEGKKSYAYEIAQDFGWKVPDRVVLPVNGGMALAKSWKGFKELKELGWIDRLPTLVAVQAAECAPIVQSFLAGEQRVAPVKKGPTISSAIAGADPGLLGDRTLKALYESGGDAMGVSDDEALRAMEMLGKEGLFVEPSGAVAIAGLRRLVAEKRVDPAEKVVCVLTGSGFKDIDPIAERVVIGDAIIRNYDEMRAVSSTI
ncbi:MAG: threonine synthase [Rhodospirillales bacterium]|nr:threonine synthase [Rhodospirillales bacterium]